MAAEAGWGAVIFAVDASGVWKLAGGVWGPVETDLAAQLFFGASHPTSPAAEVTAIASVLGMLRAARVSIPLTSLSDSQYALGVVLGEDRALSEIPLVQLARSEARCYRQRAGRHVAAHGGLAGNEAADRLADAGRRRWMVPERAAAFISCASSIPPEPEVRFFTLADRIFWQKIKDEVDPLRPFRLGRQCLEVVELTFGSANVRTLLPAERSAASRAGPPAMTGRLSLTSSTRRGFPSWVFRRLDAEDRLQVCVAALGCSPRLPHKQVMAVEMSWKFCSLWALWAA